MLNFSFLCNISYDYVSIGVTFNQRSLLENVRCFVLKLYEDVLKYSWCATESNNIHFSQLDTFITTILQQKMSFFSANLTLKASIT